MRLALKVAFSAIFLILLSNKITAQNDLSISIFYKYDYRSFLDKQEFPFGIGSSISKKFSNKLILSAGLEYSHYSHEYNNKITPATYRTREVYRESFYSLNIGLSYPLLNKKIDIRIGSCILPSYFISDWDYYRYLISDGTLDQHQKGYHDYFALGIKAKIDFVYSINSKVSFFIQPGFTYYLTDNLNSKFLNGSTGVIFTL